MIRCKECDSLLWSQASQETGVCTECREGEDTLANWQAKEQDEIYQLTED